MKEQKSEFLLDKLAKDSFCLLQGVDIKKIIDMSASWDVSQRVKALNDMYIQAFKLGYRIKENEELCQKNLKVLKQKLKPQVED